MMMVMKTIIVLLLIIIETITLNSGDMGKLLSSMPCHGHGDGLIEVQIISNSMGWQLGAG